MGVERFGTWNGIPIYVDQYMEPDKILTAKKQGGKPYREKRVKEPRTKGLDHDQVTALIMHHDTASKLECSHLISTGII